MSSEIIQSVAYHMSMHFVSSALEGRDIVMHLELGKKFGVPTF
jgi:hypothetical protein